MKNIKLCQRAVVQFPCRPIGMCSDNDNEIIYIIDDSLNLYYKPKSSGSEIIIHNLDNRLQRNQQDVLTTSDVRLVEFLVETGCILLAFCDGQIILFNLRENFVDTVLRHPCNIHAFKFSPDQDLIALLAYDNELYILSNEFEIQHKTNVILDNSSLNQPVGVGWGSKETQFFGLDGRPSKEKSTNRTRDDQPPIDIVEAILSTEDYCKNVEKFRTSHELDWHGDGRLLVTLTKLHNDKHQIKVWNRNLELQFMSDQLYYMETGLVSWIPNGQYICCAQRLSDGKQDVTLFERNGLVHQRFSLPMKNSHILISQLAWSKDSRILAIVGLEYTYVEQNTDSKWMLMLYTCNNFHWYLKHVSYIDGDHSDLRICWSESQSSQFALFSSCGIYYNYECLWQVNIAERESIVAVIDGEKLLVTPFNACSIPPPLCAIEITLPSFTKDIVLSDIFSGLIITTKGDAISMHRVDENTSTGLAENSIVKVVTKLVNAQQVSSSLHFRLWNKIEDIKTFTYWTFITSEDMVAVKHSIDEKSELYFIPGMNMNCAALKFVFPKSRVCHISSDQANAFAAVITDDGKIYHVVLKKNNTDIDITVRPWTNERGLEITIPAIETALSIKCCKINGIPRIVSMNRDMTLHMDDVSIASNNCTSFAITDHYLIYTTIDNLLRFQLIDNIYKERQGDWTRNIESGATLVSADEAYAKVALQMPRGNLEIVYPRILLFNLLVRLLDDRKFVEAIDMVRRHRINMNFIADYLHKLFKDSTELNFFAKAIGYHDITWLNLFLSELNDEDTIEGQYKSIVNQLPINIERKSQHTSNRVDAICKSLSLGDDPKLLQPHLISLIKQVPQRIDLALLKVSLLGDKSESGLRFLLYMIDIEKLFEEAMGTYDSNIALMVANISNKDPKEYLNLINGFDVIQETEYRKYKIDLHIKRYDKAITHLMEFYRVTREPKAEVELMSLVIDKRLYKNFIKQSEQIPVDEDLCKLVWRLYGQYLFEKRYYLESGIAFEKASDYPSAIKSYLLEANWLRALTVAVKLDTKNSPTSYKMIAQYLIADSKFDEGANILEKYCDDYEEAFQVYIKGRSFYSANRLAIKHDLDRNQLKEAIRNHSSELLYLMDRSLEKNKKHLARFSELRTNLENQRSQSTGQSVVLDCDTLSTIDGSDATSQTSDTTRSGASSLKTRKPSKSSKATQRKKKINLKPGSRYEDVALLTELKCFVESQDQYSIDSKSVCSSIYDVGLEIECRDTIIVLNEVVQECYEFSKLVSDSIWSNDVLRGSTNVYKIFLEKQNSPNYTIDASDMELLVKPKMSLNFTPFIL